MKDLSDLLPGGPVNCMTPTSQQAGNQIVSNERAHTAPGSQPSSPATSLTGEELDHKPPEVDQSGPTVPVGSGTRSGQAGGLPAGGVAWKKTPSAGSGPAR